MTEITTRPFFRPVATAAEARLLEGVLLNTLADLRMSFGESFVRPPRQHRAAGRGHRRQHSGRLEPGPTAVPAALRRPLRRSIGDRRDPHQPLLSRGPAGVGFRSPSGLRSARDLAGGLSQQGDHPSHPAAAPAVPGVHRRERRLPGGLRNGRRRDRQRCSPTLDSQRLLAFPNPPELDVALLYSSHPSYLEISYGLVRSGARFGANNWTPVRARSDVDPVNRNILTTAEQLRELYRRGIFAVGEHGSLEEAEQTVIVENLCARVDLPMNRVEVRTDEGGDSFDLSVAKIVLKELLLLRSSRRTRVGCGLHLRRRRRGAGAPKRGHRRSRRPRGSDRGPVERPTHHGATAARRNPRRRHAPGN